jgi:hypothetical protein
LAWLTASAAFGRNPARRRRAAARYFITVSVGPSYNIGLAEVASEAERVLAARLISELIATYES